MILIGSRYIEKFYSMRSQLQKISLRLQVSFWILRSGCPSHFSSLAFLPQTYRTNEQMMQAMRGATQALGSMNRSMNLPQLQRIAMDFERENDVIEQRQEMMDDVMDDAMEMDIEEEGDEVVEQVLEEIGVDLGQAVSDSRSYILRLARHANILRILKLSETPSGVMPNLAGESKVAQTVGGGDHGDDDLQARLDMLKR